MSVLKETQLQRDEELANLLGMSLEDVQKQPIAAPESIMVCNEERAKSITPEEYYQLYAEYAYLNWPGYIRTLMKTSSNNRHPELFRFLKGTKDKVCLDFGSGVGTHAIALLENGNSVDMLDVPGELLDFAGKRISSRGYEVLSYHNNKELVDNHYDIVVCTDVLEHVESPLKELKRIHKTMKTGGLLHLLVSCMRKPSSGHFDSSIDEWIKEGKNYVKENFEKEGATIWRKK